ncbi:NgoMIV family type II restriction endonuclease [Pontiellaceae bacterium B1224]|nr:NgoMIV family type II restriction endonuclease [Pontiellaceae bacterium B1224]
MTKSTSSLISCARESLHVELKNSLLKMDSAGIPSIADKASKTSVAFASSLFKKLGVTAGTRQNAQTSRTQFEAAIETYLRRSFLGISSLRPGTWNITRKDTRIDNSQQFLHLSDIQTAIKEDVSLAASIGQDYLIRPDIVILRRPEHDDVINPLSSHSS